MALGSMQLEEARKEIKIRVPADVYSMLEDSARREGYSSVADYVVAVLTNIARSRQIPQQEELIDRIRLRLERYVQDELNRRMSVIESIRKQVIELYEKIGSLEQKVNSIEASLSGVEKPGARAEVSSRKTAIERLKEEKVVFESKLPPRIHKDRLFAYFERSGAVVLKLSRERVAVDQDFWREFKYKLLNEVNSNRDEDILAVLGEQGYELWKALYGDNMVIFDPKYKKWRFVQGETP